MPCGRQPSGTLLLAVAGLPPGPGAALDGSRGPGRPERKQGGAPRRPAEVQSCVSEVAAQPREPIPQSGTCTYAADSVAKTTVAWSDSAGARFL